MISAGQPSKTKIAMITDGSLLPLREVKEDLMKADWVSFPFRHCSIPERLPGSDFQSDECFQDNSPWRFAQVHIRWRIHRISSD